MGERNRIGFGQERTGTNHYVKMLKEVFVCFDCNNERNFDCVINSLKIKSRAQQITLKPNIIKVKKLLANVSLFTIQHFQSNLNEFTGYGIYIYKIMV